MSGTELGYGTQGKFLGKACAGSIVPFTINFSGTAYAISLCCAQYCGLCSTPFTINFCGTDIMYAHPYPLPSPLSPFPPSLPPSPPSPLPPSFPSSSLLPLFLPPPPAQTSSPRTQDMLEPRFDKKKKGYIGAPITKKLVCFVDDVNMPAREEYGAQ
eukprot:602527-Rhodomonas_salina.1